MIKVSADSPNIPALDYLSSGTVHKGGILYRDTSNGLCKEHSSGSSDANTLTIEAISAEDATNATSAYVRAYPITGAGQMWIADCNANTAADQLNLAHELSSATVVNNTNTTISGTAGVFIALRQVGAASDKKLAGYFVKVGQVTA